MQRITPALLSTVAATILCLSATAAQTTATTAVDLETIMAHPDWLGRGPEAPYWSDDGSTVYYLRRRENEEVRPAQPDNPAFELWRLDLESGVSAPVPTEELGDADVAGGDLDDVRTKKVYARGGDIYVKDLETGAVRQLTRTAEPETDPLFLTDGRVAYRRGTAVLFRDLETGLEEQPFEIRLERDPELVRVEEREKADYLERQQRRLFAVLRSRDERKLRNEAEAREERREDPSRPDLPYFLGEKIGLRALAPSPAGRWLLAVVGPADLDEGRRPTMPHYVTESGYVETEAVRAKVGTGTPERQRLFLLDRQRHEAREIDLSALPGIEEDPLSELRQAAARRKQAEASTEPKPEGKADDEKAAKEGGTEKGSARPVSLSHLAWSEDGQRVVFQAFSHDNKDRWLAAVDLEAGTVQPLHHMHDPAWINWDFRDVGWLRDHRTVFFLSEESGHSQLYLISADDGELRRLTKGESVVSSPALSPDGRAIFYRANPGQPGVYEIWRVDPESGRSEQMTDLGGLNDAVLSPDGSRLLVTHSSMTRPPELWLQDAAPGVEAHQLTTTTSTAFLDVEWTVPRIVEVPSTHVEPPIYARLYLPAASGEGLRPAVIFIHGAGYLQNAHQGWSLYFREFMFHTLLARHGYVVLDMDYRGSAGYGRDWRTAIYRHMGGPEVEDLEDGVAWLVRHQRVDPQRIGVYGGSYGGFLTLMSLFERPELFAAGAALRPVTDWAHYNQSYTSKILNTPEVDPEAYERSSPIEHAAGLQRPLLICTGMLDDNVLFQDSVRLVQRLIELEKEDWEIAIYPLESHGFREPSSWLDEYRRIFALFEDHLR